MTRVEIILDAIKALRIHAELCYQIDLLGAAKPAQSVTFVEMSGVDLMGSDDDFEAVMKEIDPFLERKTI